jgi:hypothetical protein
MVSRLGTFIQQEQMRSIKNIQKAKQYAWNALPSFPTPSMTTHSLWFLLPISYWLECRGLLYALFTSVWAVHLMYLMYSLKITYKSQVVAPGVLLIVWICIQYTVSILHYLKTPSSIVLQSFGIIYIPLEIRKSSSICINIIFLSTECFWYGQIKPCFLFARKPRIKSMKF